MPERPRDKSGDLKRISEEALEILNNLENAQGSEDRSTEAVIQSPSEKENSNEDLKEAILTSISPPYQAPHPLWPSLQDFVDAINRGDTAFISKRADWRLDIGIESLMLEWNGKGISPIYAETGSYFVIKDAAGCWLLPSTEILTGFALAMIESPHNQHRSQIFDIEQGPVSVPFLALAAQVEPREDKWEVTCKGLMVLPIIPNKNTKISHLIAKPCQPPGYREVVGGIILCIVMASMIYGSLLLSNTPRPGAKKSSEGQRSRESIDRGPEYRNAQILELENEYQNAVLSCEHNRVIQKGILLTKSMPSNYSGRILTIVKRSKSSISDLDQPGKWGPYTEDPSCTWGFQWFDNPTHASIRVFVAISRSCREPILHYSFADSQNGNPFFKGKVPMNGHRAGEVSLAYPQREGRFSASIDKLECG